MKVYVVMYNWDNGWEYEDHYSYEGVIGVCSTEEKAIEMIKDWIPDDLYRVEDLTDEFIAGEWNKLTDAYKNYYSNDIKEFRDTFATVKNDEFDEEEKCRSFDGKRDESYSVYFNEFELV